VSSARATAQYDEEDEYADLDESDPYGYDEDDYSIEDKDDEEHVVTLTADNFESNVLKKPHALVEFYAPWCGHCKSLKPIYAAAASQIFTQDPSITIGKVDATIHEELAVEYGIEGYPTLKWFKDGKVSEYDGPRDTEGIVAWVMRKVGPASVHVDTPDAVNKLTKASDVVVLSFVTSLESAELDTHMKAAVRMDFLSDVQFAHTTNKNIASHYGITQLPAVQLLRNFDTGRKAYEGDMKNVSELIQFVDAFRLPLVIPFSEENAEKIFNSGIDKQILLFGSSDELEGALVVARKVSADNTGEVIFVVVNTDNKDSTEVLDFFGLAAKDEVQVMGFSVVTEDGAKFRFKEAFSEESLAAFANALKADKLTPDYKSADIPTQNNGPVTVVVGNSFEEIVLDKSKDVLLEIYAPWCGHCKSLAPIYSKLGNRFKKVDSVVIAKMDGTANEHPQVTGMVKGFPTILFYPATQGEKEPIEMDADRSLVGMTKFIKQHATVPFNLRGEPSKEGGEEQDVHNDEL